MIIVVMQKGKMNNETKTSIRYLSINTVILFLLVYHDSWLYDKRDKFNICAFDISYCDYCSIYNHRRSNNSSRFNYRGLTMTFILGFVIGAVAEFIALLVIAHEVQKTRNEKILGGDNNDKV